MATGDFPRAPRPCRRLGSVIAPAPAVVAVAAAVFTVVIIGSGQDSCAAATVTATALHLPGLRDGGLSLTTAGSALPGGSWTCAREPLHFISELHPLVFLHLPYVSSVKYFPPHEGQ